MKNVDGGRGVVDWRMDASIDEAGQPANRGRKHVAADEAPNVPMHGRRRAPNRRRDRSVRRDERNRSQVRMAPKKRLAPMKRYGGVVGAEQQLAFRRRGELLGDVHVDAESPAARFGIEVTETKIGNVVQDAHSFRGKGQYYTVAIDFFCFAYYPPATWVLKDVRFLTSHARCSSSVIRVTSFACSVGWGPRGLLSMS